MYFILGAGGFAREVALAIVEHEYSDTYPQGISGYLSDDPEQFKQEMVFGRCLGKIEEVPLYGGEPYYFTPGIGSPSVRKQLVNRALKIGWYPLTVVDRGALIPKTSKAKFSIGQGCVICRGVSATVNITIGDYVNVNLNCTLGHDSTLDNYVNLSPDVNISGYVHVKEGVDIGTGAVILPHITIGKDAIIGAGAVVTKDVPPGEVWVGTPAKFFKKVS